MEKSILFHCTQVSVNKMYLVLLVFFCGLHEFGNKMFWVSASPAEGQMIKSSSLLMKFESITVVYVITKSRL